VTLVDTTVLINVEKGQPLAAATIADLLEAGELAVSTVTAHELLRSPRLPAAWRDFWMDFLNAVEVVDLDMAAAEAAAVICCQPAEPEREAGRRGRSHRRDGAGIRVRRDHG
jgi:predicted nucleic acid-binding protein